MKILVCSDSHRNSEALDQLVKKHPEMDLYLHAGDSEDEEYSIRPFLSVKGNCDYFSDFPPLRILPTPQGNILIQHHPNINLSLLKKENIKFFIFGHTHVRHYEITSDIVFLNPGAISFARDSHELSYLILTIEKEKFDVSFHSLLDK